jgi:Ycf66 protein N-terminus
MLAYILAIAVGLGSFIFYMAAFFFPEVHRKYDFLWSGVGLFYALVLWICAGRITGGVLLGQTAAVALVGWLGWQTLTLRRATTSSTEKTEIAPEVEAKAKGFSPASLLSPITNLFRKPQAKSPAAEPVESVATLVEEEESAIEEFIEEATQGVESAITSEEAVEEVTHVAESAVTPEEEIEEAGSLEMLEVEAVLADSTEGSDETVEGEAMSTASESEPDEAQEASFEDFVKLEEEEEIVEAKVEPTPPQPPTADLVEAAREEKKKGNSATPIEEFAPEVELAPFAEPPREEE